MSETADNLENELQKLLQDFFRVCDTCNQASTTLDDRDTILKHQKSSLREYILNFKKNNDKGVYPSILDEIDQLEATHELETLSLYEQLKFKQTKILLRGSLVLLKVLTEKPDDINLLVEKAYQLSEVLNVLQFLETLLTSQSEVVIISVASGRNNQQLCPEFAKQIAKNQSVDIFDLDMTPDFLHSDEKCTVAKFGNQFKFRMYLRDRYPLDSALRDEEFITHRFIMDVISFILNNTNKKMIIVDSHYPTLLTDILKIGKDHAQSIGNNLHIVSGYWEGFPNIVLSQAFFESKNPNQQLINTLLEGWKEFEKYSKTEKKKEDEIQKTVYQIPKEVINKWAKIVASEGIGHLYKNLAAIPATDLLRESTPKLKPGSI